MLNEAFFDKAEKVILIKGMQKTSLIDYEPYTSTVLFVAKCNFRCGYCHNADMVVGYEKLPDIEEEEVFSFLNSRKKWIEAVVITGGEPTLNEELVEFCSKLKKLGFLVKLDTNGSNPSMIDLLVSKGLVDFISMDVKCCLEKYDKVAGVKVDISKIKETAKILMKGIVDYEFRITAVPSLVDKKDFEKIGAWLKGADKFVVQQFKPDVVLEERFKKIKPFTSSQLNDFKKVLKPFFKKVELRGI